MWQLLPLAILPLLELVPWIDSQLSSLMADGPHGVVTKLKLELCSAVFAFLRVWGLSVGH